MTRSRPRRLWVAAVIACIAIVAGVVAGIAASRDGGGGSGPLARPLATALDAAAPAVAPFAGWREVRLAAGSRCLRLVVARTVAQRRRGLSGLRDLGPYAGMVFVTERDTSTRFTMAGTLLALDLGLYGRDGLPLERRTMLPCPASVNRCPVTAGHNAYRLALEAPRGTLPAGALTGCVPG